MRQSTLLATILLFAALAPSCKDKDAPPAPTVTASASAASQSSAPLMRIPAPTGPRLAILAGKGVGPIRIGAQLSTVERHLGQKCPQREGKQCIYPRHALVFELDGEDRVLRILIHRQGRALPGNEVAGIFNGVIPPDLFFGMIVPAIQEHMGPPEKKVAGAEGAHSSTAEQHVYEGIVLEYEKLDNGKLVLGGVRIPK